MTIPVFRPLTNVGFIAINYLYSPYNFFAPLQYSGSYSALYNFLTHNFVNSEFDTEASHKILKIYYG